MHGKNTQNIRFTPAARGMLAGTLLIAVGVVSAGCSLAATDRKIDRIMERRTDLLGGGAITPGREFPPAREMRTDSQLDKKPESTNPGPDELYFDPADEDRDAAARLDSYADLGYEGTVIDLPTAFRIAQRSAREFLTAEEEYILAAIRLLVEQHRFSPRFFNDLTASIDGSTDTTNVDTAVRIVNELRATQQLPFGGNIEARLIWNAAEILRENVTGDFSTATQLVLNANVPLLRGSGPIARESLIQAERNLVYAARDFERFRREFLVTIARDYFNLVAQLSAIENQQRSLESLFQNQRRTEARVEAGRDAAFESRRFEERVLVARSRLITARERYLLTLDRFKVRLGLPIDENLIIIPTEFEIPEPEISPAMAAELAMQYRLDLQTVRDRVDDARRGLANSKNQLLPDLDLAAGLRVNTAGDDRIGNFDFDFKDTRYNASVTFGLPLDRQIERLNLRGSMISAERSRRSYEQFRDNVIVSARASVRDIDQARFSLDLAEQRVEINRLVLEQLKIEERDSIQITDAEQQLLESEDARDNAIRDLRIAILDYLLATGLMRLDREGQFLPLPGMGEVKVRGVAPEGVTP